MATYFHVMNPEIQGADGMQTLYLMNPNYVPYSDAASLPNNALLLNPVNLSHAPPPSNDHHHPLVGIPLPAPSTNNEQTSSEDINRSSSLQAIVPGVHYDLWNSIDQNSSQSHTQMISLAAAANNSNQLGLLRPVASSSSCRQQGLSLSLSSQAQQAAAYNRPINTEADRHHHPEGRGPVTVITSGDLMRVSESSPSSVSAVSNGISGMQSVLLGSKYLRAAQELLDEVVKVENVIKTDSIEETKENMKLNRESSSLAAIGEESNGGESSTKPVAELTTAQRQELQIKKAKLGTMLEEVEQRYKQYHHQMQVVVSAFEQAAGFGSAKSYTALALRTISKQFRCLKDAISLQIRATTKKLGEDDCLGAKAESSRLRYVDHQLRQQRALQQLGMMQHHAWRPQRGLPERAVTILRAWLFEHFLHPYPKDSDKHMLAKQTGLTRSQVSNWFINARVRLWKPMVEEMYLEETKEQERNGSENASKINENKEPGSNTTFPQEGKKVKAVQSKGEKFTNEIASPSEIPISTIPTSPMGGTFPATGFNLIGPSDHLEGVVLRRQKKLRNAEMQTAPSSIMSIDMDMKQRETNREIGMKFPGRETLSKDGYPLIGGFGAYSLEADIGRFNPDPQLAAPPFHGNGVSLTLGLPHCENLTLSGAQQNLLSGGQLGRGLDLGSGEPGFCGIDTAQPSHSNTGYESIGIQNRKRFATQLMPDFVT